MLSNVHSHFFVYRGGNLYMNINNYIDTMCNNTNNKNNKIVQALQIYLQNEYSEYYKINNLEKIFILAEKDMELQSKLVNSINNFVVMQ